MLDALPPRERQIVDLLYARGEATVAEVCDGLPVVLSGSAVRAMLARLEGKGFVRRQQSCAASSTPPRCPRRPLSARC
jgi:predicted transcriptional regulator